MNFVNIDKFLPYVLPYTEKCPNVVARRAIRDAIIVLAEETGATTLRCSMETVKGQDSYEFELPVGIDVERVSFVKLGSFPLKAINRDMLKQLYPNTDWRDIPGTPQYYLHTDEPKMLNIVPAPDTSGAKLTCELKLRFSRDCDEFPSIYYERYVEAVASGALARVLAMPGQPFTDLAMAAQWAQMFAQMLPSIKADVMRDFTNEAGRVVYRNVL